MHMLLGYFFTINSIEEEGDTAKAVLKLNITHPIFEGHFPGQPVVPGACLLQMVKEILQTIKGDNIQLIKAHQLKFISLINPLENSILQIVLKYRNAENGQTTASATCSYGTTICFKISGVFQTVT